MEQSKPYKSDQSVFVGTRPHVRLWFKSHSEQADFIRNRIWPTSCQYQTTQIADAHGTAYCVVVYFDAFDFFDH